MSIQILSFNIHKGTGWGIRGSKLDQIHEQIRELHPDIILLQEIKNAQFEFLASDIWPHFSYGKNAVYPKGHHGNAILSKFPIQFTKNIDLSTSRYERRGLLHSIIHIPKFNLSLHLLCVHLGLFRKDREKQLERIIQYIQENILEYEPLILGGDFNDWSGYATKPLIDKMGLEEAFMRSQGVYAKTFPAWAPLLKLDRLYFRGFSVSRAHRLMQKPWRFLSDHIALHVHLKL